MEKLDLYLTRLRDELALSVFDTGKSEYLDLAATENITSPAELASLAQPPDQLSGFQEIIMGEVANCHLDKTKIGINELLKHLLVIINPDLEEFLAERYMYRLRMIFRRCLMPDFPFQEEIWNYICDCLRSTGSFLIRGGYFTAAREIIDSLAGMGRIAALKGLPTANTQASLRTLENKALQKNEKQLALTAKNARFNLET
ncbi:MAG: hypothetical protein ACYC21_12730 [Eubacteriales bacterium]